MIITRFAPSPSGPLHMGHGYSAILAHDAARRSGGRFHVRIDDIDAGRSRAEYVDAALADLAWLGIDWDGEPWRQSAHVGDYAAALDRLRAMGVVYRCTCTRADIAESVTAPHWPIMGPLQGPSGAIYPGTCRGQSASAVDDGKPFCWRIDMARAADLAERMGGPMIAVNNGVAVPLDPRPHGDVVIARKDAPASYHLASTVDDAAMGVNLVVRGADLWPASAVHVMLQQLLGLATPDYVHHDVVCGVDGKRLAKRDGAAALSKMRAAGVDGAELAAQLRVSILPAGYSLAKG